MKLRLTTPARRDVTSRTAYLLERNPDAAVAVGADLDAALALLAAHPDAGRVVRMRGLRRSVRRWLLPPRVIYYARRGATLIVYRVRHGARRPIAR